MILDTRRMDGFNEKPKLILGSPKKWAWIAILVAAPLASLAGLVIGIALLFEPEHRKWGWLLIFWTIIWNVLMWFLISWFISNGYLPQWQPVYK